MGRDVYCRTKHWHHFDLGLANFRFHSSMVYWLPILRLHRPQIGTRLSTVVLPPLLSGMLCPHWKSKTLIWFVHHVTLHLLSKRWPIFWIQTCSRKALGMVAFLVFFLNTSDTLAWKTILSYATYDVYWLTRKGVSIPSTRSCWTGTGFTWFVCWV